MEMNNWGGETIIFAQFVTSTTDFQHLKPRVLNIYI